MSDGKIERDDTVATCCIGDRERRNVGTFGVSNAVNPSDGVADILNISVVG